VVEKKVSKMAPGAVIKELVVSHHGILGQLYKTFSFVPFPSGPNVIKPFVCSLQMFVILIMFFTGKPFQPSLIFQALHSRVGSGLTHKRKIRLERLAKGKCANLLQTFVDYRHKKLYNIGSHK
jgi:hypothetical protein